MHSAYHMMTVEIVFCFRLVKVGFDSRRPDSLWVYPTLEARWPHQPHGYKSASWRQWPYTPSRRKKSIKLKGLARRLGAYHQTIVSHTALTVFPVKYFLANFINCIWSTLCLWPEPNRRQVSRGLLKHRRPWFPVKLCCVTFRNKFCQLFLLAIKINILHIATNFSNYTNYQECLNYLLSPSITQQ